MSELPERIGHYRILGELGRGGMGVVYRGCHQETGQAVALKTVTVPKGPFLQSIRREMVSLARIRHPGIVHVLDHGVSGGLPWYAMALVEGLTLTAFRQKVFGGASNETSDWTPLRRVLTVARRLCSALSFLHGESIVHRDLKPDNVIVTDCDQPVLVDFGLAAQFEGRLGIEIEQSTTRGTGTTSYMAPEVIEREAVDARADLYAFGCMLFMLVAGRPPFLGTKKEQLLGHLLEEPPPLGTVAPFKVPRDLEQLAARLLVKDPRDRIGHADDVAAVLTSLGADPTEPLDAPTPKPYLYRPRFVGQSSILRKLVARAEGLFDRGGEIVLIGGESGVGKTRLNVELVNAVLSTTEVTVHLGQCIQGGVRPLEALRNPMLTLADQCREYGMAHTERLLGERGKVLETWFPDLASVPGQDRYEAPEPLPPTKARARLFSTMTTTLQALAKTQPVLLIIEDLQWADELTFGFLAYLSEAPELEDARLLVVANYRIEEASEELRELSSSANVHHLQLDRLDSSSVGAILSDMLALEAPPLLFGEYVWGHTEGNPFFVAEYLRTAVEAGVLNRDDHGRWQILSGNDGTEDKTLYDQLPLPGSLRALISSRLQDLSNAANTVATAGAVVGRRFKLDFVRSLVGLEESQGLKALEELYRRQILEDAKDGAVRFSHDKLKEVAYERIPSDDRKTLHGAVGDELSRRSMDADADDVTLLDLAGSVSHHYEMAGRVEEAIPFARRAARHAMATYALQATISHLEHARRMLDVVPETPERLAEKVDVRVALLTPRTVQRSMADDSIYSTCVEAEPLAVRLGDPIRLAEIRIHLAGHHYGRAEHDYSVAKARLCLDEVAHIGDLQRQALASITLGVGMLQQGDLSGIEDQLPPIVEHIERSDATRRLFGFSYPPYVVLCSVLGWAKCMRGEVSCGIEWTDRAIEVAESIENSRYGVAAAHMWASMSMAVLGDRRALSYGERCARLGKEANLPAPELMGLICEGVGAVQEGHLRRGITLLEQAIERSEQIKYLASRTDALRSLAEAHLASGYPEHAEAVCTQALQFAVQSGERKVVPELYRLAGIAATRGPSPNPTVAEQHLHRALEAAEQMGAAVYRERARCSLAELFLHEGRQDEARQAAVEARDALNHMGLSRWSTDATRVLDGLPNSPTDAAP